MLMNDMSMAGPRQPGSTMPPAPNAAALLAAKAHDRLDRFEERMVKLVGVMTVLAFAFGWVVGQVGPHLLP